MGKGEKEARRQGVERGWGGDKYSHWMGKERGRGYAQRREGGKEKGNMKGKDKLRPRTSDLSYYNWKTGMCVSNDSPNFKVDANSG